VFESAIDRSIDTYPETCVELAWKNCWTPQLLNAHRPARWIIRPDDDRWTPLPTSTIVAAGG